MRFFAVICCWTVFVLIKYLNFSARKITCLGWKYFPFHKSKLFSVYFSHSHYQSLSTFQSLFFSYTFHGKTCQFTENFRRVFFYFGILLVFCLFRSWKFEITPIWPSKLIVIFFAFQTHSHTHAFTSAMICASWFYAKNVCHLSQIRSHIVQSNFFAVCARASVVIVGFLSQYSCF